MGNHLEQLVAEWYQYNGYFVRQNVLVGKRTKGGYECELDVVAFNPVSKHLVQIEPSLDASAWKTREKRYSKKFGLGRKHIPSLFSGINIPNQIDQIALFVFASRTKHAELAGGKVAVASDLYSEIISGLQSKRVAKNAVPELFPLLRTIQHCCEFTEGFVQRKPPVTTQQSSNTVVFVKSCVEGS